MSVFKDSDALKTILGGFFQALTENADISSALTKSNMVIRFMYREPDATITINATTAPLTILCDDTTLKPDVEMSMKADTAHDFWLGNVNLAMALARRQITAKGPIPKILKLLPVIKPAYAIYPTYIKQHGLSA